jgi:hypothetical protein
MKAAFTTGPEQQQCLVGSLQGPVSAWFSCLNVQGGLMALLCLAQIGALQVIQPSGGAPTISAEAADQAAAHGVGGTTRFGLVSHF